ncbi:MAG: ABC transporter substrate-binding protein, partial [Gemmatimonadales bacterium]
MATLVRPSLVGCASLCATLACGADPGAREPGDSADTGGTAIIAFNSELQSFNPLVATDLNTIEVNTYMLFTPLLQYDESYQPRPYLASSWELDSGGVTFHLNRDVRWHDGQPVTAHDVEFTFGRAKNPETASVLSSAYLAMIESAAVIDSFTIRFGFTRPHARPLDGFWWAPVPMHLLSEVPPAEIVHSSFNRQPVGSGPFKFVRWDSGELVALDRNEEFPASMGGPPAVERV